MSDLNSILVEESTKIMRFYGNIKFAAGSMSGWISELSIFTNYITYILLICFYFENKMISK